MNVWYINIGDPTLIDDTDRQLRAGLLVEQMVKREHKVIWWSSDFYHQKKINRFGKDKIIEVNENLQIIFLHAPKYKKNISIKRLLNHYLLAKKFARYAKKLSPPDVIITSYPTIELSYEAITYGKRKNVPVIVDVRDLWPDIFKEAFPRFLKNYSGFVLFPFFKMARYIFPNATAITGITDKYIQYGLKFVSNKRKVRFKSFPFGFPYKEISRGQEELAIKKLKEKGVFLNKHEFRILFIGTLGWQVNPEPIIKSAYSLAHKKENVSFLLCGTGDRYSFLKKKSQKLGNLTLPGWIEEDEVIILMKYSHVALAPYVEHENFIKNIPNKIIEYLAGGLPILSSIDGEIGKLIKKYNVGRVYNNDSELLKNSILELQKNEKLRKQMSLNAKKLFHEKFSADKVYTEMVKYIEEITRKYYKENRNGNK